MGEPKTIIGEQFFPPLGRKGGAGNASNFR